MDSTITASMLYNYVICPHRVTLDLIGDPTDRDEVHPFVQLLWDKGNAFEEEVIRKLEVPFINLREVSLENRENATLDAMAAGEPLIYGGRIFADDLVGEPDLLRKEGSGYVAGDIKSGAGLESYSEDSIRKPKKHYAVQLAAYMDILQRNRLIGDGMPFIWDIHGQEVLYDLDSPRGPRVPDTMLSEYQSILDDVQAIAARQLDTLPAFSGECKLCHWYSVCKNELEQKDDLTLIPELGRAKRDKLIQYVSCVQAFDDLDLSILIQDNKPIIPGISIKALERFQSRARLQKQNNALPYFIQDIILPSSKVELFFDVETDPMKDVCYLHGFIERQGGDSASERYIYFFADTCEPDAERKAFADAWDYVCEASPTAIYYYSPYERTIWKKLARAYPDVVNESEIIDLFKSDIAVDLYQDIVRSKMEWPTRDLSIKSIAAYIGFEWRDVDPSGASSIQWYHQWLDAGETSLRQRILEYNEDDCRAMRVLSDEIRRLQNMR